jgi:hypothetical protein
MKTLLTLILLCFLSNTPVIAKSQALKQKTDANSVTVFVDARIGGKKRSSIKKINKSHKKFEAKGYQVVDIAIYTENGDLEGFFISYVKSNHVNK